MILGGIIVLVISGLAAGCAAIALAAAEWWLDRLD
jgi:hypothetical protein